jgi:NIMA (never in mitosis gene a)-related kinase 1/4/5
MAILIWIWFRSLDWLEQLNFHLGPEDGSSFYALKKVKINELSEKERQAALNEIRILASLDHDNIIAYKDAFIDDKENVLCIIMEYAEKGDLSSVIESHKRNRTRVDETQIWSYLIQMLRGLNSLHELKICHRDLKPANVFITDKNVVKLGDLNVSKVATIGLMQTQTGTPYYCSPEIYKGQTYDFKSDIWSLGCLIYELAMLRPPFTALDMQGLSSKVCRGVYPSIPPTYSNDLNNIVNKMLQVLPSKRLTSSALLDLPSIEANLGKTWAMLSPDNKSKDLLETIMMPKKLNDLANRLPRPKYSRGRLKRINSEPGRLPSVFRSQSRWGSASSRKQWELESAQNKFEPKSAVNSQKKDINYHLNKNPTSNRYHSKENVDRSVLQRVASNNIIPTDRVRMIDFSRRNSQDSEERKIPKDSNMINARRLSAQRKRWNEPTNMGANKPPLANFNLNIPSPRIVNPYGNETNKKPPIGLPTRAGLPPIGSKPGFGGINNQSPLMKRNYIQENYSNNRDGYNLRRNNSPFGHR